MLARLALPLAAAIALATPAIAQDGSFGPKALMHGNYCGPGNNAPLPPIDALDAACARHDACTPAHGLSSKACNVRLEREAAAVSNDRRQPDELRAVAGFVSAGAAMMPSDSRPQTRLATAPAQGGGMVATYPGTDRPGLYPGETVVVDTGVSLDADE